MIITLTGFMGCGKSSVGRRLSELLCCRFMDLDTLIEEKEGRVIPEIFSSDGEKEFRRMEKETLESLVTDQDEGKTLILALGGGCVMTPECARLVHEKTRCIYLRASTDTLITHLEGGTEGRPLLAAEDLRCRILELMSQRSETYEATAHIIIDTDGKDIEEVAAEISRMELSGI
ncbi:MAG: shikimate kinase [Bacteroidales bacterium]|nr:shikimate kinase [Bacteroidales bacterium]